MTEAQPVKRRPGRPRKNPLPAEAAAQVTPDSVAVETEAVVAVEEPVAKPVEPADERIGIEVHPLASHIGYDDGRQYLCKDGVIVELIAN